MENISIILIKGKDELKKEEKEWEGFVRTIEFYSEKTIGEEGISKKLQFKCLDIIDELEE